MDRRTFIKSLPAVAALSTTLGREAEASVRTSIAPGTREVLVFGGTSGTHPSFAASGFPVPRNAAHREFDCFFHLGDHVVYQDGSHPPTRRDTTSPDQLWRSFKWGDTAEFFLLDVRSERDPSKSQFISRAQMDSLKNGLKNSTATFKFILTPVPVSTFPAAAPHVYDRWEGYHTQRTEILGWIRDMHLSGVWWLAGDYPMGSVGHLEEYGHQWYGMREVLMGAGGNSRDVEGPQQRAGSAQWDFSTAQNNYFVYTADPIAQTLRVSCYTAGGTLLFDRTYQATFVPGGLTVSGAIGTKYNSAGMGGLLGKPLTKEHATGDGAGSWQQFQYGYIYWHPNTGAHEIHGAILDRWADEGWSESYLGYPVTDEYEVGTAGDREQEFQYGRIHWSASTATTTLYWK
jgi:hypothetical protein